jgi:hypothetical protein
MLVGEQDIALGECSGMTPETYCSATSRVAADSGRTLVRDKLDRRRRCPGRRAVRRHLVLELIVEARPMHPFKGFVIVAVQFNGPPAADAYRKVLTVCRAAHRRNGASGLPIEPESDLHNPSEEAPDERVPLELLISLALTTQVERSMFPIQASGSTAAPVFRNVT